jgi:hypothetical protein
VYNYKKNDDVSKIQIRGGCGLINIF